MKTATLASAAALFGTRCDSQQQSVSEDAAPPASPHVSYDAASVYPDVQETIPETESEAPKPIKEEDAPVATEAAEAEMQQHERTYTIGGTEIRAIEYRKGDAPSYTLFNMHDDENAGVEAGKQSIEEEGGRLVELIYDNTRFIKFELDGREYQFDPNRIFTDAGIEQTMTRWGHYTPEAHALVRKFAQQLVHDYKLLDRSKPVVTLHNNCNHRYSINSYTRGGEYSWAAEDVHVTPSRDPDNFFFVVERPVFDQLKARNYNVVLQKPNANDDGSLSYVAAQHDVQYINIEAQDGEVEVQKEMLDELRDVLQQMA